MGINIKKESQGNETNTIISNCWYSINELLPEIGEKILSYSLDEGIKQTTYTTYQKGSIGYTEGRKDCWFEWITHDNFCKKHQATHWMKMPILPSI